VVQMRLNTASNQMGNSKSYNRSLAGKWVSASAPAAALSRVHRLGGGYKVSG